MRSKPSSILARAIQVALFSSACGLCLTVSADELAAALAQTADENADVGEMSLENLFKLDSIMVTAQKRVQNAQDVPLSVATLRGDALEALNASGSDVRQLSARLPSLLVESSFGRTFPRFYLRGMGNTDFDLLASQPVSLIMDEVVLENALLKGFPMFDMDRVEVLRGPQGTLFGRNTPAGIVKFESRKPGKDFDAKATLGFGTFDSVNFDGALNLPISDTVSARLSMISQTRADWIDNAAPGFEQKDQLGGYDDKAGRFQLSAKPSDKLDMLFNYHFRNMEGDSRVFMANIIARGSNSFVDGFESDSIYQDAAARNRQEVNMDGGSFKLTYDFGPVSLFYIGGYESVDMFSQGDIDGGYGACFLDPDQQACAAGPTGIDQHQQTDFMGPGFVPFPAETSAAMPEHKQISHEFRLASNELGLLDYQVGLFWFNEDLTIEDRNYNTLGGGVENGKSVQTMQTDSWGVFVSLDLQWTERFGTVAGLRYSADERDWRGELVQSPFGAPPFSTTAKVDDSQVSWDVSASFKLDDDVKFYGRVAQGYRAPSIQGRNLLFSGEPTTADSETLLSIEAGFKSELLNNRARINGALFHYTADGQQLTAVGGSNNSAQLINAKETVGYGAELESEFAVTPSFLLGIGFSYNKTELNDSELAVQICGSGCTVTDPTIDINGATYAIVDGNPLPQSPEYIFDLTARYAWEIGSGELYVYTDWAYRSEVNFTLYESKEFKSDALLEGGLRVGYQWTVTKNKCEFAFVGRNITNEESLEGGIDFNNLTGYLNDPRYFGIEFKAKML